MEAAGDTGGLFLFRSLMPSGRFGTVVRVTKVTSLRRNFCLGGGQCETACAFFGLWIGVFGRVASGGGGVGGRLEVCGGDSGVHAGAVVGAGGGELDSPEREHSVESV